MEWQLIVIYGALAVMFTILGGFVLYVLTDLYYVVFGDLINRRKRTRKARKWE